jgi:hypothetical protein
VPRHTVKAIPYHIPPRANSPRRFNVKIQKLLLPALPAADQRKAWLLDFCRRIIVVRSQQISAIGRYLNKRCAADSLRKRDKNSAMILRHDHNPAK